MSSCRTCSLRSITRERKSCGQYPQEDDEQGRIRWQVYYRSPDKKQRKKNFARKTDAKRYAATVEADLARHDWVDPQRGRHPFGDWAAKWITTTTHLKPKTRESYESILKNHLIPEFGDRPIASIEHPEVLTFLSGLQAAGKGAGTVRNVCDVMRLVSNSPSHPEPSRRTRPKGSRHRVPRRRR